MKRLAIFGLLLSACGPIPVQLAEQQCIEPAQLAQRPRGSIGIVADSNGNVGTTLSIGISSDYLAGRDPVDVYTQCVIRRTGSGPIRPPVLR